jgi:hypothetical protein
VRPSFADTVVPDITAVGITGGVVIGINDEQKSAPLWQAAVAERHNPIGVFHLPGSLTESHRFSSRRPSS